jgi:hypothetical protein
MGPFSSSQHKLTKRFFGSSSEKNGWTDNKLCDLELSSMQQRPENKMTQITQVLNKPHCY